MNTGETAITNREILREFFGNANSASICEWNPTKDILARLGDPYHDIAVAESSMKGYGTLRVCDSCAIRLARINGGGK